MNRGSAAISFDSYEETMSARIHLCRKRIRHGPQQAGPPATTNDDTEQGMTGGGGGEAVIRSCVGAVEFCECCREGASMVARCI